MFCRKCGTEIKDGVKFCPVCGTKVNQESNQQIYSVNNSTNQFTDKAPVSNGQAVNNANVEYAPVMSVWSYLGLFLLSAIPIVGVIIIIVFAINSSNKNKSNYCRAIILMWVISFVLLLIFGSSLAGILYSLT
ncbi:zinc ribbon domain-containing protein [Sporofaciens sp. SGI.106]|uniref:zinc ribbon domain-containing protein n=1 Tax=Sporofaciens sp. SGI.106 TaxID=3420568 RepID=UPI002AA05417|nr:zinc ribbon domain-containing protein [Lachnoclostridium sp.]